MVWMIFNVWTFSSTDKESGLSCSLYIIEKIKTVSLCRVSLTVETKAWVLYLHGQFSREIELTLDNSGRFSHV